MITEPGLAALRRAATLVHAVPSLRVQVRHGGRLLVDVAPHGTPIPDGASKAVTPCGFRSAVAQAWARHGEGERSVFGDRVLGDWAFGDLPVGVEPAVELGVPPCGRNFPGDIYGVPLTGRYLYVFATTYPIDRCRARADHHLCDVDAPSGLCSLGLRHDEATAVSLVYAELDAEHRGASEAPTVDLLQALLADIAVRQLLDELSVANG